MPIRGSIHGSPPPEPPLPAEERPIRFGTDGWRGRIAEEITLAGMRRCAAGISAYLREHREGGDPRGRGIRRAVSLPPVRGGSRRGPLQGRIRPDPQPGAGAHPGPVLPGRQRRRIPGRDDHRQPQSARVQRAEAQGLRRRDPGARADRADGPGNPRRRSLSGRRGRSSPASFLSSLLPPGDPGARGHPGDPLGAAPGRRRLDARDGRRPSGSGPGGRQEPGPDPARPDRSPLRREQPRAHRQEPGNAPPDRPEGPGGGGLRHRRRRRPARRLRRAGPLSLSPDPPSGAGAPLHREPGRAGRDRQDLRGLAPHGAHRAAARPPLSRPAGGLQARGPPSPEERDPSGRRGERGLRLPGIHSREGRDSLVAPSPGGHGPVRTCPSRAWWRGWRRNTEGTATTGSISSVPPRWGAGSRRGSPRRRPGRSPGCGSRRSTAWTA